MPGPRPTAPLGTVSSYKRAIRNGQEPTAACRAAWAAYHRDLYRRRKQRLFAQADSARTDAVHHPRQPAD
jgi:hypothetical protein